MIFEIISKSGTKEIQEGNYLYIRNNVPEPTFTVMEIKGAEHIERETYTKDHTYRRCGGR